MLRRTSTPLMLRATPVALISSYAYFVKTQAKTFPQGTLVAKSAPIIAKRWAQLTKAEKEVLAAKAAKVAPKRSAAERQERKERRLRREKKAAKGPKGSRRAPSPMAMYVKQNYDSVRHLPFKERLGALAKQYKALSAAKVQNLKDQAAAQFAKKSKK